MVAEIKADDVLVILDLLEKHGIPVWLNGGWGVDALLKEQTRSHRDVDIVIQNQDVPRMRLLLGKAGFSVIRDEEKWWNFVMGDGYGREIDVHAVTIDNAGNGRYGPKNELWPAVDALTGLGFIKGRAVHCLTADCQIADHTDYPLREDDFNDVQALKKRFGIELPEQYRLIDTNVSD